MAKAWLEPPTARVPRSCTMTPVDVTVHSAAWFWPEGAMLLKPATCPRALIPKASPKSPPGRVPRSVMPLGTAANSGREGVRVGAVGCPESPQLIRSEEHTSELQSRLHLVCRLLLEKKKIRKTNMS